MTLPREPELADAEAARLLREIANNPTQAVIWPVEHRGTTEGGLMNYDQPRELADHSGWHYTSMNDGQVWAIGYCCQHLDQPHPTRGEAYACYTRYLLDNELRLDGQNVNTWHRCQFESCGTLTDRFAQVGHYLGPIYDLCDSHRTREVVTELFGTVGDSVHS